MYKDLQQHSPARPLRPSHPINYGTVTSVLSTSPRRRRSHSRPALRSLSLPVRPRRVVVYRRHPRQQLTVGQQSAKLAEEAAHNFFHGSFTSSHGAYFTALTRAQQRATSFALPHPPSRAASRTRSSSARRGPRQPRPLPASLLNTDAATLPSAMKKTSTTPVAPTASELGTPLRISFTAEPFAVPEGAIVLKRRAASAEPRLQHEGLAQTSSSATAAAGEAHAGSSALALPSASGVVAPRQASPVPAAAATVTAVVGTTMRETSGPTLELRNSSPDLLALQRMRAESATRRQQAPLSPTTLARAREALRAFERQKVKAPDSFFRDGKGDVVRVEGGTLLPVPHETPLVLAAPPSSPTRLAARVAGRRPTPLHVQINPVIKREIDRGTNGMAEDDTKEEEEETEEDETEEEEVIGWGTAVMDLLYLAAPAAVSIGFTFATSVVPLAFIGNYLGADALTGATVGYFITSIAILYPMIGLTFAMDTLCSHEYGRDPLSNEMGLVLQRGVVINLLMLTPLCVAIYYLDVILVPLYGVQTARHAEEFLTYAPFFLVPIMLFTAFNKFLNNQMQAHLPTIALTAGIILTPFLQMKLTPMGARYTMLGMAITAWVQLIVVVVLTLFNPDTRATLGSWRLREALQWDDVKAYMKLAIPSAIFVAAEASSFDLTMLICAQFGTIDGAAWSGILNSLYLLDAISGGLSASACANVGRCVGANAPQSARRFVFLSVFIVTLVALVNSTLFIVFFNFVMSLFGTRGATLAVARQLLPLIPFFHVCDSVQFTFQGIFSGLGKNHLGAIILLSSLWGLGIPLAILFGRYLGYHVFGVCFGLTVGLCIEAPVMVLVACYMDYEDICLKFLEEDESGSSGDDEEDDEDDEEEDDEEEEYDEQYIEEVLRRSGIHTQVEPREELVKNYKELLPPQRHRRRRRQPRVRDVSAESGEP